MQAIDNIVSAIQALRMKLTPSSITPGDVADIMQAIVDFIQTLSLAPQSEILNLNQQLASALNAANSALETANSANTNASNQHITVFEPVQQANGVIIRLKQSGSAALQLSIPIGTALKAGLLSKEMFKMITDAKDKIDNKVSDRIDYAASATGIQLKIIKHDGEIIDCDLDGATEQLAGIMTAADKQRLNSLPEANEVAKVEQSGGMKYANAPYTLLRNVAATSFTEDPVQAGDNYFEDGHIFHATATDPIDLGTPSSQLIYCLQDTGALYRWVGSRFVPCVEDPKAGLEIREIGAYSASSKRYDIPAGVLAIVKPTTDTANINLQAGVTGRAAVHRIIIEKVDAASLSEDNDKGLKWMQSLMWENGNPPTLQDINFNAGIVVTIYHRRYGSFYVIEEQPSRQEG